MKKEKLGFFKKLSMVITDFRTYPFLVKHEKFLKSIVYLVILTLIASLIFTINIAQNLSAALEEISKKYEEIIPEFELKNGELDIYAKYNEKIDNNSFLVVDTDYTYEEYTKTKEYSRLVIYDMIIFVNEDKIVVEIAGESTYEIIFADFEYQINKERLYNEITKLPENFDFIPYFITLYLSVFVGYFTAVFLKVLFLGCIVSIMCMFTGVRLNFKNYIKIAIYAYTLPFIMELISLCLGVSGKDYVYYTTSLLTYIYIIYAVRAIRLDAFIMLFSKKENVKHTSIEFENELKKYNEIVNNNTIKNTNEEDKTKEKKEDNEEDSNK